jgi:hypothetical protein
MMDFILPIMGVMTIADLCI